MDEQDSQDKQGIHSQVVVDMLEPDIVPVVLVVLDMADMVEVAEHPADAQDSPASVLHIRCFAEQEGYLFQIVVALHSLAGEAHRVSKLDETMAPLMDRQARHWSHVRDT